MTSVRRVRSGWNDRSWAPKPSIDRIYTRLRLKVKARSLELAAGAIAERRIVVVVEIRVLILRELGMEVNGCELADHGRAAV